MHQTLSSKAHNETTKGKPKSLSSGPASQVREEKLRKDCFGGQCELGMNSVSLGVERITHLGQSFSLSPHEPQHNFISILWPRVRQGPKEPTEMGSLIPVIVLANLPHGHQGLQVLIGLVGVDVVQGTAVPGVPIRGCEIYSYLEEKIGKWVDLK